MICPACGGAEGTSVRRFSVDSAAEHFVPRQRDPARHGRLVAHLEGVLWGQDHVEIQECPRCEFGFAVPWVGGDPEFYALAHEGDPHYPGDRWEFGETLRVLSSSITAKPLHIAEVGAGEGAFLDQLGDGYSIVAADFDDGAVQRLRAKGYHAIPGTLQDLAAIEEPFDVLCMFQTLEHMADLDTVALMVKRIVKPGGDLFLSVPNKLATDFQEDATGLWDMPPNHVGRWTREALTQAFGRRGIEAVDLRLEPLHTGTVTRQLAVSMVNARAYVEGALEQRVNALRLRPLRGPLKRVIALRRVPGLLRQRAAYHPLTIWAHLKT